MWSAILSPDFFFNDFKIGNSDPVCNPGSRYCSESWNL